MKTGYTATELGLYSTECCTAELIFDVGDTFIPCPQCLELCTWKCEDEIVTPEELEQLDGLAA